MPGGTKRNKSVFQRYNEGTHGEGELYLVKQMRNKSVG